MQYTKYILWLKSPFMKRIITHPWFLRIFPKHAMDQYEILGLHYSSNASLGISGDALGKQKSLDNIQQDSSIQGTFRKGSGFVNPRYKGSGSEPKMYKVKE